jgi:hypothetical protein
MPGSSGADDFRAKQLPAFEPVDDLSRFVLDRIREAETEPVADQVEPNGQPMAYRYAKHVRRDMVAFRRIAAEYCDLFTDAQNGPTWSELYAALLDGIKGAMTVVANRWDDHHDFQEEWRVTA